MRGSGKQRLRESLISRTGVFRSGGGYYAISSDRVTGPIAGRRARHDGVAMCLLRKDFAHAIPMRRAHRVARNRRVLVLLWVMTLLWWCLGWFF